MSTGFILLMVFGPLVFVGLLLVFIFRVTKQRARELLANIEASGDRIVRGPARALIRRGHVTWRGPVVLTDKRIVFQGGGRSEVPLESIQLVRTEPSYNGETFNGAPWTIITWPGGEAGLLAYERDFYQWVQRAMEERKAAVASQPHASPG